MCAIFVTMRVLFGSDPHIKTSQVTEQSLVFFRMKLNFPLQIPFFPALSIPHGIHIKSASAQYLGW